MTQRPTLIIGIDPGMHGAVAIVNAADPQRTPWVVDLPTVGAKRGKYARDIDSLALAQCLAPYHDHATAYVEQVTSRPRQAGQFAFGTNYGRVLGVLGALRIPVVHAAPGKWKLAMGLRGDDKARSVQLAAELFPTLKADLVGKRGAALDGRAEALLIAYYGSRQP